MLATEELAPLESKLRRVIRRSDGIELGEVTLSWTSRFQKLAEEGTEAEHEVHRHLITARCSGSARDQAKVLVDAALPARLDEGFIWVTGGYVFLILTTHVWDTTLQQIVATGVFDASPCAQPPHQ
jgi:hypothetical protein